MKKSGKILLLPLCLILAGLTFYSCSELFLPKRVEIKGMVDLPVKIGITNIGSVLTNIVEKAFSTSTDEVQPEVYAVNYDGQTIQTFCIYFPIEVTEDLNPDHFLRIINRQLNDGLSHAPKKLYLEMPVVGTGGLEVDLRNNAADLVDIPKISLDEITRYVIDIDFAKCEGMIDSGIGLNFYFDTVVPGLKMTVRCNELGILDTHDLVEKKNIVFGNSKALTGVDTLNLAGNSGIKTFTFEVTVLSNESDNTKLHVTGGLTPGSNFVVYDGEVAVFQNWTRATIDLEAAIRADDGLTGSFPRSAGEPDYIDLSSMGEYFDGFTFEGMEARLYMVGTPIEGLGPKLRLDAQYGGGKEGGNLFYDSFSTDIESLVLDDRYINDHFYIREHLPGISDDIPELNLDEDTLADIFSTMPDDLRFTYTIEADQYVVIHPNTVIDDPNTPDSSKVIAAVMILLPMHLKAVRDDSTISIPDVFKNLDDLFDRKEAGNIFPSVDVRAIRMSINFLEPMFLGGQFFLDGNKSQTPLLFSPGGIKLNNKNITVDFTAEQLEILKNNLIKPNIWFKFMKNDEIFVPKTLGIMSIKFEMRGIVDIEELLE
jgi:hypothetical protein